MEDINKELFYNGDVLEDVLEDVDDELLRSREVCPLCCVGLSDI